ncbi:hypothetical protein THAOC_28099 [Thalassiosira oceanica]|uniref:DUF6743 domain-containing protein n=1 Tax=Thalassiosira oceanica TaxID=159749 RepID=K0S152_THAOC|nr:hypothetical protein THAOC_28099 [Thalassiosira oceanica]|eukprot:EJK52607.1 hypothetical protein THAOC_28099 [Thalassiosira oceanica]
MQGALPSEAAQIQAQISNQDEAQTPRPSWAPSPQLVKGGRTRSWMREDTWHFEVEVLRVYGRQELWSHGFGARPVSDGPYQPVDAADVRRRVAFGARQDNEFAVRHCCVHRSRWSVVSGARVPRGTSKPLATTSSASEREEAVRPHNSKFPRRSFSRERSPTSTGGPRACYRRRGKLSDGGSSLSTLVGTTSSASALEVRGLLRSIGRNKLFSHPPIPGFVTGNWLNLALPCWIALSWKWISFQLTCFTLLVTGRNPFGGTLGDDGDRAGPAQGRAVLAGFVRGKLALRRLYPSICLG